MAALGLTHVERNGHHYFHGLDHLPTSEVEQALAQHPDLYRKEGAGAALRIEHGRLRIASLQAPGYGHTLRPAMEERTPFESWSFPPA